MNKKITNKEFRKGISLLLAKRFQLFVLNHEMFSKLEKLELNLLFSEVSDMRVSEGEIKEEFGKFGLDLRPGSILEKSNGIPEAPGL